MRDANSRILKFLPVRPQMVEWILIIFFIAVTVGFGITYTRLIYERHQEQMKLTLEEKRLAREKVRQQELLQKYEQATRYPDDFVAENASRLLRRAPAGTHAEVLVFTDRGESSYQSQPTTAQEAPPEEAPSFWQQWLQVLHINTGE